MTITISGTIEDSTIEKLIEAYNNLKVEDELYIYLNSRGGTYSAAEAIIHLINRKANRTSLFAFGQLHSCAFEIFFLAKCKKEIIGNCLGMYHQSTTKVIIDENNKTPYTEDKAVVINQTKHMKKTTLRVCEHVGMTDKEISQISKGKDVYFQPDRLREFLEISKSNKL